MDYRRAAIVVLCLVITSSGRAENKPLPSWNDTAATEKIIAFVRAITDRSSREYVAPEERIVVCDSDGTLIIEQPMYMLLRFTLDRVKELAPKHPEWQHREAFTAILENRYQPPAGGGKHEILELFTSSFAGISTAEFDCLARDWLATARHPRFHRPWVELVYRPMQELFAFLRANEFKIWVVSGTTAEFLRPWMEKVYGVPPERVIGSRVELRLEARNGTPVLVRRAELEFANDRENKVIAIEKLIGRRPIAALGNSDGDLPMLEWTAAGAGRRLVVLIHHDDAEREYAYDRESRYGRLDRALAVAGDRGWTIVSMLKDWRLVYPFEACPSR